MKEAEINARLAKVLGYQAPDGRPLILALDASSTNVGWCIARGDHYINSDVFSPRARAKPWERITQIVTWLDRTLKAYDVDYVAIEEPMGHHANLKTDRLLARVCGNIEAVCTIRGIPSLFIHPKKVKATGYSKDNQREAAWLVGKETVTNDEADAIGIWQALLVQFREQGIMNIIAHDDAKNPS